MAKQKFVHFVPRDKPPKLGPGRHKKNLNNSQIAYQANIKSRKICFRLQSKFILNHLLGNISSCLDLAEQDIYQTELNVML